MNRLVKIVLAFGFLSFLCGTLSAMEPQRPVRISILSLKKEPIFIGYSKNGLRRLADLQGLFVFYNQEIKLPPSTLVVALPNISNINGSNTYEVFWDKEPHSNDGPLKLFKHEHSSLTGGLLYRSTGDLPMGFTHARITIHETGLVTLDKTS